MFGKFLALWNVEINAADMGTEFVKRRCVLVLQRASSKVEQNQVRLETYLQEADTHLQESAFCAWRAATQREITANDYVKLRDKRLMHAVLAKLHSKITILENVQQRE